MDKIYFYDLGVRNILIENLNPVQLRQDVGALWENFLIMERRKKLAYDNAFASTYFWRTYSGAELDYVEDSNGELHGYEFKFKSKKRKPPKSWIKDYNQASFQQIHSENFLPFVV